MTDWISRGVMKLALAGMGPHRTDWSAAMRAEFAVAQDANDGLSFALGCLATSWRELPTYPEGSLALSRYTFAIGFLLPMAALLLAGLWYGYPWVEPPIADEIASFARVPTGSPTIIHMANASAVPHLASLLLLRVACLVLVAWFSVEANWDRAAALQRLGTAATITLTLFAAIIVADFTCVILPLLALGVEFLSITLLRRWHGKHEAVGGL